MPPEFLFHGSIHRIEAALRPSRARDRSGTRENMRVGVYATPKRSVAIAVAICKAVKGRAAVNLLHLDEQRPPGELWWGTVATDRIVYLYTCGSATFEPCQGQWVSPLPVVPVRREELRVGDYLHLLRRVPPHEAVLKLAGCYATHVYGAVTARLLGKS